MTAVPTPTPTGLRERLARRRATARRIEAEATAQVDVDERELRTKRRHLTLWQVWGRFWSHPSPWVLTAAAIVTVTTRVLLGAWSWVDLAVPVVIVATFPFTEWVVHVFVLHARPRQVGPWTYDSRLARDHRAHHVDPRDLPLVFIPFPSLMVILPMQVVGALLLAPRIGLAFTYLATLSVIGVVYEWTHYLIHSDYRPRSALYRSIWRGHRLHHYKNERYWFTVTTAGTADRVLGTYPDPSEVETSPTARDLLGTR